MFCKDIYPEMCPRRHRSVWTYLANVSGDGAACKTIHQSSCDVRENTHRGYRSANTVPKGIHRRPEELEKSAMSISGPQTDTSRAITTFRARNMRHFVCSNLWNLFLTRRNQPETLAFATKRTRRSRFAK